MIEEKRILDIDKLSVAFQTEAGLKEVLHEVSFNLKKNEILGIVGESGSGKSLTVLSVLGLLAQAARITNGSIFFEDKNLLNASENELQNLRGNEISMIFQEPMSSLNPSHKCGFQVEEIILQHKKISKTEAKAQTITLFEKVKLPDPEAIYNAYPHQISGGQKQRVMIAMAIACKPKILIADEPTTALDVTVQKDILLLLKELQQETNMSILFITHDLSVVKNIADRIFVMYRGEIVEQGDTSSVFNKPKNQYTQALLSSIPSTTERAKKLPTIKDFLENKVEFETEKPKERQQRHQKIYAAAPILEVRNVSKTFISKAGIFQKNRIVKAVDDVNFSVYEGETLGLVGESGCGKSTLGSIILQLLSATSGEIFYRGKDLTKVSRSELRQLRKEIQIIFQDPYASLNPRLTVGRAIMEPMIVHKLYKNNKERKERTLELIERVGLTREHFDRYPHEFSGGQRQRIGIARTIALQPKLIVCDESVSALDISVQAQVLNLLNELKENFGFTYIFISHDLAVVKYMSDQLLVMNKGRIEEKGDADEIYASPQKAYTKKLIDAIPRGFS